MPKKSPFNIELSSDELAVLRRRARKYTLPYFEVLRAKIILLAAEGRPNHEIAAALWVGRDVVSLWRKRFFYERLAGLEQRPRSGRPRHTSRKVSSDR
jgi:transposase